MVYEATGKQIHLAIKSNPASYLETCSEIVILVGICELLSEQRTVRLGHPIPPVLALGKMPHPISHVLPCYFAIYKGRDNPQAH